MTKIKIQIVFGDDGAIRETRANVNFPLEIEVVDFSGDDSVCLACESDGWARPAHIWSYRPELGLLLTPGTDE